MPDRKSNDLPKCILCKSLFKILLNSTENEGGFFSVVGKRQNPPVFSLDAFSAAVVSMLIDRLVLGLSFLCS